MAVWDGPHTSTFTHMGAEGAPGSAAPFTRMPARVSPNLGDGTYFHSGCSHPRRGRGRREHDVQDPFYNDAVAMTGGQPFDGSARRDDLAPDSAAEGVSPIVAVVDEKEALPAGLTWAPGTDESGRARTSTRCSASCARKKEAFRRSLRADLRHREAPAAESAKSFPIPARRVVINEMVCEGCGDCSVQSNWPSVEPLETGSVASARSPVLVQQGLIPA